MKTNWDYTSLADAYLKRPDYSDYAIDAMLSIAGVKQGYKVCDIGAGVAHLTLMLASKGLEITAVEPNDAMRANGIKRTAKLNNVNWFEGTGESNGQSSNTYELVTFGSSFNVCDRQVALKETARILKPSGWFACMWNHRDLNDPIQESIENIIKSKVPEYGYGVRREDQSSEINKSELFNPVIQRNSKIIHYQSIEECLEAWRSHGTLQRQAKNKFNEVISSIGEYLNNLSDTIKINNKIEIPYKTNIWIAQLK